ncbi:MAG: crossover junction endodeoxyribonuclease RuvC [Gemmataceae bacterium]|nr:crossover junction endodeoxyribonuclease RuvC [Gemmataceae bacterium]
MDEPHCVLGIDPGLNITGYGVLQRHPTRPIVREAGVLRPGDAKNDLTMRLKAIYDGVLELLEQFKPEAMAVEQLYAHYAHPRTAILMGHARGAIFLAAAQRGVAVFSYSATRIKKTVTGHGRASKEQVQRTIERELGLKKPPEPPDVADALAVALCHVHLMKLPSIV